MTGLPDEWDADSYDRLPLPHERWGEGVLSRLPLHGDEHVLDAGCGTGRDTALLLARLPQGHVTAVDASASMLDRLRRRFSDEEKGRLTVLRADLTEPLSVHRPVDAVLSVAALHWIGDHAAVFRNLAAVMVPGARLSAECGGRGNVQEVLAAVQRASGDDSSGIGWHFPGADATEQVLREAGFGDVHAGLRPSPARFRNDEVFREYLATVILVRHLALLEPSERGAFVAAVAAELPTRTVDYVRLELTAVLPS